MAQMEKRLAALEKSVAELKETSERQRWWREGAGRFANDPDFEEIVRLGRQYRDSLRPKKPKRKA
jgi:hypothetical protein